jgi:4-nitrophenyl phosphatase
MRLKPYKAILLDGDGVLWKSEQPIPGIQDFFTYLNDRAVRWALLTNNNTRTAQAYIDKLGGFGIQADHQSVFTSSTATADYLLAKYGQEAYFHVVGMDGLTDTLKGAGFRFSHGEDEPEGPVAAVVAGMDREINLHKVTIAMRLIQNGADFIATNTDGSFPTPEGIKPGTGTVIGALHYASGTAPYVVGKPQSAIFETALNALGAEPDQSLMVGDRLETDILGANQLGIDSAAVMTGVTSREEIMDHEIQPDFLFDDIVDLHQALKEVYQ